MHALRTYKQEIEKQLKDLGSKDSVLGIGTKIETLSMLQVRDKNERTRNQEQKLKKLQKRNS